MARLNDDTQVAAKCQCGHTTVGAAYPVVCAKCQSVVRKPAQWQGIRNYTAEELSEKAALADPVDHPVHYTSHASGIEVIQITEHMGFCLGNAVKYILRCDLKGNAIEDLKKARWYLDREIAKREAKP